MPPHHSPTRRFRCETFAPPLVEVFSEFRVGLDHVAFGCAAREELDKRGSGSTNSGSSMATSRMRITAPV